MILALTLDPTISIGNILGAVATVVSITGAWWAIRGRVEHIENLLTRFEARINTHETKLEKLQEIAGSLAATLQRMIGQQEIRDRVVEWNGTSNRRGRGKSGE